MKIVLTDSDGAYLVEKIDCGNPYCGSSAQYAAAAQPWMSGIDQ
jgi:hypothetical protein